MARKAAQSTGLVQVFNQGPGNSLKSHWDFAGQPWGQAQIDGAGTAYSAPAVVYSTAHSGLTQVIVEGPGNSLRNYWDTYGVPWSGPGQVDGTGTTFSAPAVVYSGTDGNTQVFNEGPDNSLRSHRDSYGNPWNTAVVSGSGTTFSTPTAVYSANNGGVTQVIAEGPGQPAQLLGHLRRPVERPRTGLRKQHCLLRPCSSRDAVKRIHSAPSPRPWQQLA